MADKYDEMIDSALSQSSGGDKYDQMINEALNTSKQTEKPQEQPGMLSRAANFVAEEGIPVVGGAIGAGLAAPMAIASGPFALAVLAGGGALGAAGARGWQRVAQYATGNQVAQTTGQAISDINSAALGGATNELAGPVLGKIGESVSPFIKKGAQQVIRGMTGIRESVSGPVISDPMRLIGAKSSKVVSDAYKAFENYTGLKGIQSQEVETGVLASPTKMLQDVYDAAGKVFRGEKLDPQELYTASQNASKLKQMAKYQNPPPEVLSRAAAIDQSKGMIDDALQSIYPEYKSLRSDYAQRKAVDQFSSIAPLQRNLSPDALRMMIQAGSAGAALMAGNPVGVIAPAAFSPIVYGAGLLAGQAAKGIATSAPAKVMYRVGTQSLADAYMNQPR